METDSPRVRLMYMLATWAWCLKPNHELVMLWNQVRSQSLTDECNDVLWLYKNRPLENCTD